MRLIAHYPEITPIEEQQMNKILIFVGMMVGSSVGWWAGAHVGMMTAFLASGAGSIAGVYAGWRFAQWLVE